MIKKGLSVVVLTHNETDKIAKALNSVKKIADQIVIVDDYSEDRFIKHCRKIAPKCEIYQRNLDDFATQKNFGIGKVKYEWILNLDADEEVSAQLQNEIKEIASSDTEFDAFKINFTTLYFGKYLEGHENHVRLFRNNGSEFQHSVHEAINVIGKVGALQGKIIHHHWNSYSEWFKKLDIYAHNAALGDIRNGKNYSRFGIIIRMIAIPVINFLDGFLVKKRWKLGFAGLVHSLVGGANAVRRFAVYYEIKYKNPELFKSEFRKGRKD